MDESKNHATLISLEDWFREECNGDWEHSYGIVIETSDNPGWIVKIDLKETELFGRGPLQKRQKNDSKSWLNIDIDDVSFLGTCSIGLINDVIEEFLYFKRYLILKT